MISRFTNFIFFLILLTGTGCQSSWSKKDTFSANRVSEPPLSERMTSAELVNFLNRQNRDLNGWRSTSTKMEVKFPNIPRQRLNGAIACQAPNYFRLTASNLIATADLGSNNQRCWVYSKPGEGAVMTWRHEDTPLLQQVPTGVPYIDPNWLMLVLGVSPLNPNEYDIRPSEAGQLWLTAIEDTASGRPIRRVIKVDRVRRVIREHAIYDSEANLLVSAVLGNHRWSGDKLIPNSVTLSFPRMKSEIRLAFSDVETNPHLPDSLWHLPDHDLEVVDLGEVIRSRFAPDTFPSRQEDFSSAVAETNGQYQPPQVKLQQPVFGDSGFAEPVRTVFGDDSPTRHAFVEPSTIRSLDDSFSSEFDGMNTTAEADAIPEPEWSASPISQTRAIEASSAAPAPPASQKRRGFLDRFRR